MLKNRSPIFFIPSEKFYSNEKLNGLEIHINSTTIRSLDDCFVDDQFSHRQNNSDDFKTIYPPENNLNLQKMDLELTTRVDVEMQRFCSSFEHQNVFEVLHLRLPTINDFVLYLSEELQESFTVFFSMYIENCGEFIDYLLSQNNEKFQKRLRIFWQNISTQIVPLLESPVLFEAIRSIDTHLYAV